MLKAPPLQTATATIDTLAARLHSATLLEDRRAAILGLRSFAKQYPASVASGSLRELITTLRRDGLGDTTSTKPGGKESRGDGAGDIDTIRLVLETLLILFNPDTASPEAGDEIAYFMADEFAMRQDNIALLLSLLDPTSPYADYYSRLYSLQLLTAICAARPERLQECVLSAPLGVSRLVVVLDDSRDAVRNAGLMLLVDLTSGATDDLRKIVAFEDVFARIFALVQAEGGLADAGITAQDCLSLLANLVKGSASNQTMFRESGCVAQMARLLQDAFPPPTAEVAFVAQARERGAFGLLQLLGLLLEPGEASTLQNQSAFFRAGTAQVLIDLGFCGNLPTAIRASALKCAAALIASNPPVQESFAPLTVAVSSAPETTSKPTAPTNGTRSAASSARGSARHSAETPRTYIIEALLNLSLDCPQDDVSLRSSSTLLIKAYLSHHDRIRAHFLQRAIAGHTEHEAAANVLTTLLRPGADPTSVVFASSIVSDLVADNPEAKAALAAVVEGDESEDEDVLTAIQAFGSQLQTALQLTDERLVGAYAGLLTVLLWEYADGVNNLLAEGSGLVQALVSASNPVPTGNAITAGVSAALLGTVYEFSTKDSPISRRTLAPLLTQKLGRSKYLTALTELRRDPAIRDFDLEDASGADDGILSQPFVDLFLLEFSRLRKAVDKDPGFEVLPPSVAEAGVDRDVLDDLRQQVQTAKEALSQAHQDALTDAQQAEQERMAMTKELQTSAAEVERMRRINQAVQAGHETELETVASKHQQSLQQTNLAHQQALQQTSLVHQRALASAKAEVEQASQRTLSEQSAASAQKMGELERRLAELGNAHRSEKAGHGNTARQLEVLTAAHAELGTRELDLRNRFDDLGQLHIKLTQEYQTVQAQAARLVTELESVKTQLERRDHEASQLTVEVKELRDELQAKENELTAERAGFEELEKEVEARKTEVEAARSELATARTSTTPIAVDTTRLAELESTAAEAREGEKLAKEELEGLLLVMGDLEAKRDEYRGQIKELGGEVSEGEEDDDEEDGEDEEVEEEEEGTEKDGEKAE